MITKEEIKNLIIIDIETVGQYKDYNTFLENNKILADLYEDFYIKRHKEDCENVEDCYESKSALYAEFGKIINISLGKIEFDESNNFKEVKIHSYSSDNENELLTKFKSGLLALLRANSNLILCGHNIENFDIPYISKRMLINRIELPNILQVHKVKPWERRILDTMTIFKFNSYGNTSLNLLCGVLGVDSPKDELSGDKIHSYYYNEEVETTKSLEYIKNYCEKDVIATSHVVLKMAFLI